MERSYQAYILMAETNELKFINVPAWTLSPIFNWDIFIIFPFAREILAEDGKQQQLLASTASQTAWNKINFIIEIQ